MKNQIIFQSSTFKLSTGSTILLNFEDEVYDV